jgi:hypothetical protein
MRIRALAAAASLGLILVVLWIYPVQADLDRPAGLSYTVPAMPGPASQMLANQTIGGPKNQAAQTSPAVILSPKAAALRVITPPADLFNLLEPYFIYAEGAEAKAVGIGDFNNDGRQDVAMTTGWPENELYIFTQTLTGTLSAPVHYLSASQPNALATGDLNADGRDDVATANFDDDTISVYYQQADGTLQDQLLLPTADGPDAIVIGDVNHDNLADVVVSHWLEGLVGVYLQNTNGTLDVRADYASPQAGWDDIAIGDLNGDGWQDVVKMNGQFPANPNLSVYLQGADGKLQDALPYDLGPAVGGGVAAGDVTGDGLVDAVLSYGSNRPSSQIAVFSQSISGTLGVTTTYPALDLPEALEVADLNADGRSDVLLVHGGWSSLSVYVQLDTGTLAPYQSYTLPVPGAVHYGPQALAVGDINGDDLPDVLVADEANGLVVLYHRPPRQLLFFPFTTQPIPETQTPITDDFSDPTSGWPNINSSYVIFDYLDGEYQILNLGPYIAGFATAGHRLADLDVRVSARQEGPASGAYGLAFGYTDVIPVSEYYAFIIWPDYQEWNLIRFDFEDGFEILYWGVTGDIGTGETSNRLRVVRDGDFIGLSVNGRQVFATIKPIYSGSRLIGFIQTPIDLFYDARFDDYELISP